MAFLCTRVVREPNTDENNKKLERCIRYLRQSIKLPLVLEVDSANIIKWWVDGACAVHNNMQSHTGALMTLGKGAAYVTLMRKKLHTRSSTEAELVKVDGVMALM
jgi:hypothetical protein